MKFWGVCQSYISSYHRHQQRLNHQLEWFRNAAPITQKLNYQLTTSWLSLSYPTNNTHVDTAICHQSADARWEIMWWKCSFWSSHDIESMHLYTKEVITIYMSRAQWLRNRASDSRLREPGFESCAAVLKSWARFFTLHCSSSLSCINEYLATDNGGYVYEQPLRINCSIWLDGVCRDAVWVNRSVREVKCKALWTFLRTGYCAI